MVHDDRAIQRTDKARTGRILQVNVSSGGLPKTPVARARVQRLGVAGDAYAERDVHGERDQAVLLIAREWLDVLAAEGYAVQPGALGENLTVEGLHLGGLGPGTRLSVGTALLRVTKARAPCRAIEPLGTGIGKRIFNARVRDGDATDPLWGASGLMCAVDEEGEVAPGDRITRVDA